MSKEKGGCVCEDNGKEFVDDVVQPIFNDNGVMQSWEIELKKVIVIHRILSSAHASPMLRYIPLTLMEKFLRT